MFHSGFCTGCSITLGFIRQAGVFNAGLYQLGIEMKLGFPYTYVLNSQVNLGLNNPETIHGG
jgi:hypothetical protein